MKKPTGDTLVYLNDFRETAKLLIEDVESIEAQLDEAKSPATFEKALTTSRLWSFRRTSIFRR